MASTSREIITLQIGTYANFVGAHWWNIQQSSFIFDKAEAEVDDSRLNHDVLFRLGTNQQGKSTYTPRLVIVDDRDKLGCVRLGGSQYSECYAAESPKTWSGRSVLKKQESRTKNPFANDTDSDTSSFPECTGGSKVENLEETVKSWTDFTRVSYHPKTLQSCPSLSGATAECSDVSSYQAGIDLMASLDFSEALEDRLRYFAEDCDYLQGFHLLHDVHGGFAGLTGELVGLLENDYSSKVKVQFPVQPAVLQAKTSVDHSTYLLNAARFLTGTSGDLIAPISIAEGLCDPHCGRRTLKHTKMQVNLPYHTGAILATCLETITTTCRQRMFPRSLAEIVSRLTYSGNKMTAVAMTIPSKQEESLLSNELACQQSLLCGNRIHGVTCLSPGVMLHDLVGSSDADIPIQSVRGLQGPFPTSIGHCKQPIYTYPPFPRIFADNVWCNASNRRSPHGRLSDGISSAASLWVSPESGASIFDIQRRLLTSGGSKLKLDQSSWSELCEAMTGLAEAYRIDA